MKLYRGRAEFGTTVEVEFEQVVIRTGDEGRLVGAICRNCGSLVHDAERHADFHYAIAAGRPYGEGPPPGFRP